jgi:dihydroorotate dehydrogenase electron transfer subunit
MMPISDIPGRVLKNREVAQGYYLLSIRLSQPLPQVNAGQFVMVKVPSPEVFLRRPFSIYDYRRGTLSILYKVSGKGTVALSRVERGSEILVLGPLGNGFTLLPRHLPVVVAGGIGLAGVHLLWSKIRGRGQLYWGCASESEAGLISGLQADEPNIATMDGSLGCKGNVVDLLSQRLPHMNGPFQVFACGPEAMFLTLKEVLQEKQPPCQILVEERMACGIGVCFGCVKKTTDASEPYKRVCKEGPVFDLWQTSL